MTTTPEGVEVRNDSIRISFVYRGQRCRETLRGLKPTKANIRYAEQKRASILYEIERGIFDYAAHFPRSKRAGFFSPSRPDKLLGVALDEYLAFKKPQVAVSTLRGYTSKAETHIRPKWGKRTFRSITQSEIDQWISVDLIGLKNKTINDVLVVFRALWNRAAKDKIIDQVPEIDNLEIDIDPPDPFTRKEIASIENTPTSRDNEYNAILFDIWSGLRVSELLALGWDDIDLEAWEVNVCRACVREEYKRTKTRAGRRTVELLEEAIIVLKRQKAITYMRKPITIDVMQADNKTVKKEVWRPVFVNTNTGEPIPSDNYLRQRFLSYHLKKAKVRYRGPKHCRDTYASQMLTIGMPREWIARQMGHASTRTLETRYAKWIKEDQLPLAAMASERLKEHKGSAEQPAEQEAPAPHLRPIKK